jgi:hypothetical protein
MVSGVSLEDRLDGDDLVVMLLQSHPLVIPRARR